MSDLDLDELESATKGLVYVSDGTRPSEKLGRIVDAHRLLVAEVRWLRRMTKQFDTEDELREHVHQLNDDGIATHIVIMDSNGHSVLASLTGCYADGFAYYSPDEDGLMHCCNCAECGPKCQERSDDWTPAFPVIGLVSGDE